jgi:hypothetical protein
MGHEVIQPVNKTPRTPSGAIATTMLLVWFFVSGCASSNTAARLQAREAEVISSRTGQSDDGANTYFVTLSYDEASGVHSTITTQVDQLTFVRCRLAGRLCVIPGPDKGVTVVRCDD